MTHLNDDKGVLEAFIKGKWVRFDFQSEDINFDKENPQLKLEYLGKDFNYRIRKGIIDYPQDNLSEHIWKKLTKG